MMNFKIHNKIKKYTVINNKTGYKNDYSTITWNVAWLFVFICGVILGATFF